MPRKHNKRKVNKCRTGLRNWGRKKKKEYLWSEAKFSWTTTFDLNAITSFSSSTLLSNRYPYFYKWRFYLQPRIKNHWLSHRLTHFKAVALSQVGTLGSFQQAFQCMTESQCLQPLAADTLPKPSCFLCCQQLPFCKWFDICVGAASRTLLTGW